jgi:cobalt-zinc-cadmium efflux system outer membrane protein
LLIEVVMRARRYGSRHPSPKRPIAARFCIAVLFAVGAGRALAEETRASPLGEHEAVSRALGRAALGEVIDAQIEVQEGQRRVASAYPNPEVVYMREQTFGTGGTREDYLSLSQTIDLGNRRGLRGDAAEATTAAIRHDAERERHTLAAEARRRFYQALHEQERIGALEGWTARIDEALLIVSRREASGDAATYDRRRLEREHAVARGRLESERAALEGARARLAAMLGEGAFAMVVAGVLLPEGEPPELPSLQAKAQVRPERLALDRRLVAASRERQAAARWWLPDVRVEAGWKGVDLGSQGGRTDGFLLGASLALPLWDQSSGQARVAEGEARLARARRDLLDTEMQGALRGARAEAVLLRRAAEEFRQRTEVASGDLVRIASAGYGGGELGLLELLDAYRGAADDALMALDLAFDARKARIELDRMTGGGMP